MQYKNILLLEIWLLFLYKIFFFTLRLRLNLLAIKMSSSESEKSLSEVEDSSHITSEEESTLTEEGTFLSLFQLLFLYIF